MTPNDRSVGVREVVVDLQGRSHANPEIEDVEARGGTRAPVPLDSRAVTTVPSGELELALWPSPESAEPTNGGTEPLTGFGNVGRRRGPTLCSEEEQVPASSSRRGIPVDLFGGST